MISLGPMILKEEDPGVGLDEEEDKIPPGSEILLQESFPLRSSSFEEQVGRTDPTSSFDSLHSLMFSSKSYFSITGYD